MPVRLNPARLEDEASLAAALARVLGTQPRLVTARRRGAGPDFVFRAGGHTFLVEAKRRGDLLAVQGALYQLEAFRCTSRTAADAVPVVAVPLMGQKSAAFLAERGVSWIDLAGNARIVAPGLRILIAGNKGAAALRGRPRDAFAPKRGRISHLLLLDPDRRWRQCELAQASGLDAGYVSRTVQVLIAAGLVRREGGDVRPRDAASYFDAWHDSYRFSQHRVLKGHVGARSGEELCRVVAESATRASLRYALTALPAAFHLTAFGGFRLVTAYLEPAPDPAWLAALRFREEPRGANLWLVVPKDEGVFLGAREVGGVTCASPVQVSLDLKGHPERSTEADAELRRRLIPWSSRDGQSSASV